MRLAVVGGGFCGLAVAYYAAKRGYGVTLFDKGGIGSGASGIACGLLHCYAGPMAKCSFRGQEGLNATYSLFEEVGYQPRRGILRPEVAGMHFSEAACNQDLQWWDKEVCQEKLAQLLPLAGLFIGSGATVDCKLYLELLWKACQNLGVQLQQEMITGPIEGYDRLIFTVGADLSLLEHVAHPPIERIRGQTLELEWPYPQPLPFALNAGVQLAQIAPDAVWAGATYERSHLTEEQAEEQIRKKVALFAPAFANLSLKSRRTAYRAATGNKRPFITHSPPNIYVLGGMGSKGLLYHALYASELVSSL